MVTIEITADTAGEAADVVLMLTRGNLPSAAELLEKTGIVADKVDERLVELKERGVFDRPTS